MVLLVKVWRFQPSEIEAMTLDGFEGWISEALTELRARQRQGG